MLRRSTPFVPLLLLSAAFAQQPAEPARPQAPPPMPLPQALVLPRGDRELTIDGTLTDWPELPQLQLDDQRQLSGTAANAWRGPNDLSAAAFLVWDDDALYVACIVKDEWHRALDKDSLRSSEIPAADSVVLTFDPERDTRALGPDPGRREDREFWLADESGRQVVLWDRLRGTARTLDGETARLVVLHSKEESLTHYEARIPWAEILPAGRRPYAGQVFDLQIVVNDFDESTDPMPQTRIGWTFGCGPIVDPGLLGSAMLLGGPLDGAPPDFPPKPSPSEPPLPPEDHWRDLTAALLKSPPEVYRGDGAPAQSGGLSRFTVLEQIESHCERFPRVDFVELNHRIHRRMVREVAGIHARGLPSWWQARLIAVSKAAEDPVPNASVRLFRLPMGGWLVRTTTGGFLIDAAGADLAEWLWGGAQFCVLTQPLDMTRRNDQLLLRMSGAEPRRPVLTHIAFHLPVVAMNEMPLVVPGQEIGRPGEVRVQALSQPIDGDKVTWSCSYDIRLPVGPRLVVVGPDLQVAEAPEGPVDLLILSPRNPNAPAIAARCRPGLVVLDDAFVCRARPDVPRAPLRNLHALQRALLPLPSLILAPGESVDVTAANPK